MAKYKYMDKNNFGKGAIKDTRDIRDYLYKDIAGASKPFDWSFGFDVEILDGKLPVKNQAQTSACGGFAWATYSYVLDSTNREEKSEKFIYSHTHIGTGGSDGRTNCDFCVKNGDCSKTLCPLPNPLTEAEITRTDDITALAYANAKTNEEKSYLAVNCDIDTVAQAMRDCSGVVLGVSGNNSTGTWLSTYPSPSPAQWEHWLYAGKTRVVNGKKYIGVLNSWGNSVGEQGWQYLSEDYFKQNLVWACWTMIYNANIPYTFIPTIRFGQTGLPVKMLQTKLGISADGQFGNQTLQAVKAFQLRHGLVADGVAGPLTCNMLNTV